LQAHRSPLSTPVASRQQGQEQHTLDNTKLHIEVASAQLHTSQQAPHYLHVQRPLPRYTHTVARNKPRKLTSTLNSTSSSPALKRASSCFMMSCGIRLWTADAYTPAGAAPQAQSKAVAVPPPGCSTHMPNETGMRIPTVNTEQRDQPLPAATQHSPG
jgi:hypothetical protein